MKKIPKQEYTAEFKEQAVKHAQATGIPVAAKELGLVEQLGLDSPAELSVRLAQSKPGISTVLVGFSDREQLAAALRWTARGPLDPAIVQQVLRLSIME